MQDDTKHLTETELRQPWWFAECELIKDYMPPYPDENTKPTFQVKHTPSNTFLRYSCGPRQGHFWDNYGDDYMTDDLARLAVSQAPPPPGVTVPPGVEEIEAWRHKLKEQQVEIRGLRQQVEDRDDTIKYLREQLSTVHDAVRGHERR